MWGRVLFGGFGSADEMVDDSNGDARSEDMVGQLGVGMILCRPFQLHDRLAAQSDVGAANPKRTDGYPHPLQQLRLSTLHLLRGQQVELLLLRGSLQPQELRVSIKP